MYWGGWEVIACGYFKRHFSEDEAKDVAPCGSLPKRTSIDPIPLSPVRPVACCDNDFTPTDFTGFRFGVVVMMRLDETLLEGSDRRGVDHEAVSVCFLQGVSPLQK